MDLFQFKGRSFSSSNDPLCGFAASSCRNGGSIGPCGVKNFMHAGEIARGHKTSQNDCFNGVLHRVDDRKNVSIPENADPRENNFRRWNGFTEEYFNESILWPGDDTYSILPFSVSLS